MRKNTIIVRSSAKNLSSGRGLPNELEQQIERLQITVLQNQQIIDGHNQLIQTLTKAFQNNEKQLQELRNANKALAGQKQALNRQLRASADELERCRLQNARGQAQLRANLGLQSQNARLSSRVLQLEQQQRNRIYDNRLTDLKAQELLNRSLHKLKTELSEMAERVKELQRENARQEKERERAVADYCELQALWRKGQETIEVGRKQLTSVRAQCQELQTQRKRFQDEIALKSSYILKLTKDCESMRAKLDSSDKSEELAASKRELELAQLRAERLVHELKARDERLSELSSELYALQRELKDSERLKSVEEGRQQRQREKRSQSVLVQIESLDRAVQPSLQCTFCGQRLREPVTIIPCGHCFCLGCKKGYGRECSRCGPGVVIEATYRNELMDEIIRLHAILMSVKDLLRRSI